MDITRMRGARWMVPPSPESTEVQTLDTVKHSSVKMVTSVPDVECCEWFGGVQL